MGPWDGGMEEVWKVPEVSMEGLACKFFVQDPGPIHFLVKTSEDV